MSKLFVPAIASAFPNAENIIDRFHDKQVLIDALDEVRKTEQKTVFGQKRLFQGWRLFMVPKAKLSVEQEARIAEMSKRYPQTGRAYRIAASLDDFYGSRTMEEAAEILKQHRERILANFRNRLTNAIC